jgi:hypothetical protein
MITMALGLTPLALAYSTTLPKSYVSIYHPVSSFKKYGTGLA